MIKAFCGEIGRRARLVCFESYLMDSCFAVLEIAMEDGSRIERCFFPRHLAGIFRQYGCGRISL